MLKFGWHPETNFLDCGKGLITMSAAPQDARVTVPFDNRR